MGKLITIAENVELKSVDRNLPPLLLIHGGPGLDSSYFQRPFAGLDLPSSVYTYDQAGLDSIATPSVEELVQELINKVNETRNQTERNPILFAHSWGTHLALQALKKPNELEIAGLVLCNPLPLTWSDLLSCMNTLANRLDSDTLARVDALEKEGTVEAGRQVMVLALRAYLSPSSSDPGLTFNKYSPRINAALIEQLEGYASSLDDFATPDHTLVIYGADDYIPSGVLGNAAKVTNAVTLPRVGHFPFAEDPGAFGRILREFIGNFTS